MALSWQIIPDSAYASAGPKSRTEFVLIDVNDDKIYRVHTTGKDDGTGSFINKISRTYMTVIDTNEISSALNYIQSALQDDEYLYVGMSDSFDTSNDNLLSTTVNSIIIKYRKSDLSEVARGSYTSSQSELIASMSFGRGWNSGQILVLFVTSCAENYNHWGDNRLLFYNQNTLSHDDTLIICDQELDPIYGYAGGNGQHIGRCTQFTVDSAGDIYLLGANPAHLDNQTGMGPSYQMAIRISKIDSSLAINTFYDFPFAPDAQYVESTIRGYGESFYLDEDNNALIFVGPAIRLLGYHFDSYFVRISMSGTLLDFVTYPMLSLPGDTRIMHGLSENKTQEDFTTYGGIRSFWATDTTVDGSGNLPQDKVVRQIDPSNGNILNTITKPTGNNIDVSFYGIQVDPEERLWSPANFTDGRKVLLVYAENSNFLDEKILAYGMASGLGRGWN